MKRLLLVTGLAVMATCTFGAEKTAKNPLLASDTVVWAGLDYSQVRMIGPGEFKDPQAIFPGMLQAWNDLFLQERIRFMESETKKHVIVDIGGVTEANKIATSKQIINAPGSDDVIEKSLITPQDIARAVKGYKMENKSGLGVVFVVDRLVKQDKNGIGAVYVVGFDIASREVLFSEREVNKAMGFGFRNYWFRVIKGAEKGLKQCR
jgi:hypothetical protein